MPDLLPPALRHPLRTARRLAADRRGNVAMFFGLALVPLAIAGGTALDYARATNVRTFLDAAADAAALSAVTPSSMTLSSAQARQVALDFFNARVSSMPTPPEVTPTVTVEPVGGQRQATVSFSTPVPTTLIRLAGWDTVTVTGMARASSPLPAHIDFHLLLDNTPSMGVGATPADVATMVANTKDQCAFACHDLSANGKDYYALAKSLNVTMRIDVVRQATQKLMDTATAMTVVPGQFRMAIHTFGNSCVAAGLQTLSNLTTNLAAAKSSAGLIDLMTIPYQNYNRDQCTDYDGNFAVVNGLIAAPGDGYSAANPQKVLFLVSDGVADANYPSTCSMPTDKGRCQEPIKPADCRVLKDRGVRIAVLYTTYLPLPTNGWYNKWIKPFASDIGTRMRECASPDLYFEVSPTGGIAEAMDALFKKSLQQARLSQ